MGQGTGLLGHLRASTGLRGVSDLFQCSEGVAVPAPGRLLSGGGGVWHKASVSDCVPLAPPIGLSPPLILTLCGPERVLVVSTEPPDDLSCLTTPGVGRPGDGLLPVPVTRGGGGGLWDPKFCVPKMAGPDFHNGKFYCLWQCTSKRG